MIDILARNALYTLIMTYAINTAISHSPIVKNRWLPLITLVIGVLVGSLIGTFYDPSHFMQNIVAGALGGSMATWLDEFVSHTILNITKDEQK